MEISFLALSSTDRPLSCTAPYSVAAQSRSCLGTLTMLPSAREGTMVEIEPFFAVDFRAMMPLPPSDNLGTPMGIQLPPCSRVLDGPNGLGTHLSGEIDGHGGVDACHEIVFRDYFRFVHITAPKNEDTRIVVHPVIHTLGPQGKSADKLSRPELFVPIANAAFLKEIDHTLGEHFGVDA